MPTKAQLAMRQVLQDAMVEGWQGYMETPERPSAWTSSVFAALAEVIQEAVSRDEELTIHFSEAYLGIGKYANDKIEAPARLRFGAYLDALIDNVNATGAIPRYQRLTLLLLLTISQWEASVRNVALAVNGFCRIADGRGPASGTARARARVLLEKATMTYHPRQSRWQGKTFGRAFDELEQTVRKARSNGTLTQVSTQKLQSFVRSCRGKGRGGPAGTRPLGLDRFRNGILHGDFDVRKDGGIDLDVAHSWRHWLLTGKTPRVRTMDASALADNLSMARGLAAMGWAFNNAVSKVPTLPSDS